MVGGRRMGDGWRARADKKHPMVVDVPVFVGQIVEAACASLAEATGEAEGIKVDPEGADLIRRRCQWGPGRRFGVAHLASSDGSEMGP